MANFAVTLVHGPGWDPARGIREQRCWPQHAAFMDGLVDTGLIILGGPLGAGDRTLHVVEAADEGEIRARLAEDPWASMGMLQIGAIEPWSLWLDSRENPAGPPAPGAPPGYGTVTPWLISAGTAQLIDFTVRAFGAVELGRVPGPDGGIGHAEVRIGDSVVMMFDTPDGWPGTPGFARLYVEDGDAVYQRALDAGATPVTAMTDLFFGDRVGRVRDPLGNIWWIQEHVADVDPAELAQRPQDPAAAEALRYVEQTLAGALHS